MDERQSPRAELLRILVELDHRPDLAARAMERLVIAIGATVVYLAGPQGYELYRGRCEAEHARTRTFELLAIGHVSEPACREVCLPIHSLGFRGGLYALAAAAFTSDDISLVELFASRLEAVASMLQHRSDLPSETLAFQLRRVRSVIARRGGNVSAAARDLGVRRSFIYRVLRRDPET